MQDRDPARDNGEASSDREGEEQPSQSLREEGEDGEDLMDNMEA